MPLEELHAQQPQYAVEAVHIMPAQAQRAQQERGCRHNLQRAHFSGQLPVADVAAVLCHPVVDQLDLEQFHQEVNAAFLLLHTSLMHLHSRPYIYLYLMNLTVCHT